MKKLLTLLYFFTAISLHAQSVSISSSASGSICPGANVTFIATTSGITNPIYQWIKNGIAISGANSSTYSTATLSNNDQIKV